MRALVPPQKGAYARSWSLGRGRRAMVLFNGCSPTGQSARGELLASDVDAWVRAGKAGEIDPPQDLNHRSDPCQTIHRSTT